MVSEIFHPSKEEFQQMLKEEGILIVDFFATWCGPCKMLSPVMEQIAEEYGDKLKVVKIDIDKNSELSEEYEVQSVPTVFIIKNGEIVSRETGFNPFNKYSQLIDKCL